MKQRLIALTIVAAFFIFSVAFGFIIGKAMNKNSIVDNQCLEQLSSCTEALTTDDNSNGGQNLSLGISAPIPEAPGFMRYLSKTGVSFVYPEKITYAKDKPASEVVVKELPAEGLVDIQLSLADAPNITQDVFFTDLGHQQTPAQYAKDANLTSSEIALQSSDKVLAVKRYAKVLKIIANPVNTYALDKSSDDLRLVEFTDYDNTLAYVSFSNNELFGDLIIPFINSISMVKK